MPCQPDVGTGAGGLNVVRWVVRVNGGDTGSVGRDFARRFEVDKHICSSPRRWYGQLRIDVLL